MTKYKVKFIHPNPFRHMDRYPIRPDKVAALRESFHQTGYWGNIVARLRPDGEPEIAYGHHRLVAMQQEFRPNDEVDLIIFALSDEYMLKIMASENMEEWGTSAAVEHETVRAVVEAYGAGQIDLPTPSSKTRGVRYAPSFVPDLASSRDDAKLDRPYTAPQIADFLGWTDRRGKAQAKVHNALAALEFIELGLLTEKTFVGLGSKQAEAVVEQTRREKKFRDDQAAIQRQEAERRAKIAKEAEDRRIKADQDRKQREAEATKARDAAQRAAAETKARKARQDAERAAREQREAQEAQRRAEARAASATTKAKQAATNVGNKVAGDIASGKRGYKEASAIAAAARDQARGPKPPPHITAYAATTATEISKILRQDSALLKRVLAMIQFKKNLRAERGGDKQLRELILVLDQLAGRAASLRDQLAGEEAITGNVVAIRQRELTN